MADTTGRGTAREENGSKGYNRPDGGFDRSHGFRVRARKIGADFRDIDCVTGAYLLEFTASDQYIRENYLAQLDEGRKRDDDDKWNIKYAAALGLEGFIVVHSIDRVRRLAHAEHVVAVLKADLEKNPQDAYACQAFYRLLTGNRWQGGSQNEVLRRIRAHDL